MKSVAASDLPDNKQPTQAPDQNTTRIKHENTVFCASIAGLLAAAANAADISWQAPATISGTSDVNTQGTLYGSWAPGDDYQGDF